jgi:hypothetical protein
MSRETNPEVTSENSKKWSPNYGSGGSMKVEIKPFDEKINFGLWQRRMCSAPDFNSLIFDIFI